MKSILLFLFSVVLFLLFVPKASSQSCEMYFSEYLEGASNNKAIEVYNNTGDTVDLTHYKIYRYNNGSPTPTDSLFMQGLLAPDSVFIAGNPSAIASILAVSDTLHTITFFNGDDAMALVNITTGITLDVIGVIGVDPGTNWVVGTGATSEFTLVRNVAITSGTTNWATSVNQWDVYPQNTDSYLNSHTANLCCISTSSSQTISSCDSLVSPSGLFTWYSDGIYNDTVPNSTGCDSIITIDLTINTVNVNVTSADPVLTAAASGAGYQWLDCANGFAQLSGITSQIFTATENGLFAVEVTQNGCTDTSDCFQIISVALENSLAPVEMKMWPNPAGDYLFVDLGKVASQTTLTITDITGQVLSVNTYYHLREIKTNLSVEAGLYFLMVTKADGSQSILPFVKE